MSTSTRSNPYYPAKLEARENELITARRINADLQSRPAAPLDPAQPKPAEPPPANIAGLALSGGGIRSATFCLGVLQALAKAGLLKRLDYLSTVSGGGYIGSFLGAWIAREGNTVGGVEQKLATLTANEVVFLRENGRYLAPNGSGDAWTAGVTYVRNWLSMLVVIGSLALGVFMLGEAFKLGLNAYHGWGGERIDSTVLSAFAVAWSPFWKFALWLVVLGALPVAIAHWLVFPIRSRPAGSLFLVIGAALYVAGALVFKPEWLPDFIARQPWPWFAVPVITLDWCWWADRRQRLHASQRVNALSRSIGFLAHHLTLWLLVASVIVLTYGIVAKAHWLPPAIHESPLRWIGLLLVLLLNRVVREIAPRCLSWLRPVFAPTAEASVSAASSPPGSNFASPLPTTTTFAASARRRANALATTAVNTVQRVTQIDPGDFAAARAALTNWLALLLAWTVAIAVFAFVDSAGQTIAESHRAVGKWLWTILSPAVLVAFMQWLAPRLLASDKADAKPPVKLSLVLWVLALLVALATAIGLATAARLWTEQLAGTDYTRVFLGEWVLQPFAAVAAAALGLLFVSSVLGQYLQFVNLSGHHHLYASRLTRAYLGASNPERHQSQRNWQVTETVTGDMIEYGAYQPHAHGGPLHLINVTINETMSGLSNIEQRDRKGLSFAIGPAGLSVRRTDHALFTPDAFSRMRSATIEPLENAPEATAPSPASVTSGRHDSFHVFVDTTEPRPQRVEMPTVGAWVAMSGAAFTTGLGARTNLAASFLLGLLNVRLGYWWDSRIEPDHRRGVARQTELQRFMSQVARMFPAHVAFADELFARFHGVGRRHWYLSDGGHFENTACYELLRRRVPFILCCDCGCDPDYTFEDAANLIRKARIDFGIEIKFLDAGELSTFSAAAKKVIGPLSALRPRRNASEPSKLAAAHAALARIIYGHGVPDGWLLLIKPTLSAAISRDVLHYAVETPPFPQQSTMDQNFDEAQWESYRRLGYQTGEMLFAAPELTGPVAPTGGGWAPNFSPAPPPVAPIPPAAPPTLDPTQLLKEFVQLVNASTPRQT